MKPEFKNWKLKLAEGVYSEAGSGKKGGLQTRITSHFLQKSAIRANLIRMLVKDGVPFYFTKSPNLRSMLPPKTVPSIRTLKRIIYKLRFFVEDKIQSEMHGKPFTLSFDGWTHHHRHYVGVFSSFLLNGTPTERFLSFDQFESRDKLGADSYALLLQDTMKNFALDPEKLLCLVGDHAGVNRKLAKEYLGKPLVGCYAHRLNLALSSFLLNYEHIPKVTAKIREIMQYGRTIIGRAKWDKLINKVYQNENIQSRGGYSPVVHNVTRWKSRFYMFQRYFKLQPKGVRKKLVEYYVDAVNEKKREERNRWNHLITCWSHVKNMR